MNEKFAVVIPAYNEAATIREIAAAALSYVADVIVVDDGSSDDTVRAVEGLSLTYLRNPANEGKAASLWRGMQCALAHDCSAVVTLDGDGQHRPEDIPRVIAAYRLHESQIVIGARTRDRNAAPWLRRFANRSADFWISWAAGQWITDTQSGFRVYPAALLRVLQARHNRTHSFVFESEALIEAAHRGYHVAFVPIGTIYQTNARPSHFRPVVDVARIMRMVGWKLVSRGLSPRGLYRALQTRHSARDEA